MISLELDEAYAFDLLSVLDIKRPISNKDEDNFNRTSSQIKMQIGSELYDQIVRSKTYTELFNVNKMIYDLIDLMRQTKQYLDARVVDDANTQRYIIKKRLQSEFFNSELVENKNI